MAIVKHTTSKNMSYGDVLDYFTYKHKEDSARGLYEPILDSDGLMQPREDCAIACLNPQGLEADPGNWWYACMQTNLAFGKNQEKKDRKQHQYIISHPEEDRPKLTMEDLLEEGKAFVRENLPGYDALIAVHRDTDNDHVHICVNSVRAIEREPQPWMMKNEDGSIRISETCAGGKHQDNPEFRKHYNDWLLEYTRERGLAQKDNNAIAEVHKQERYAQRNQELADSIRQAARESCTLPALIERLQREKIFLLKKGHYYCVLGPKNRNAVRLETLGIEPQELPLLQKELTENAAETQSKEFMIEKRKYIEWVQHRREQNNRRAEDALADAAHLITLAAGRKATKEEFRDLSDLLKQAIYVQRDLHTELDKVDRLMERWLRFQEPQQDPAQHRQDERFIRWCGCDSLSPQEFSGLSGSRDAISLQLKHMESIEQALRRTASLWRGSTAGFSLDPDPIVRRDQLSQKLSVIRQNRKKLEKIAFRCEEAARRRIYKDDYLKKAAYFRELWYQKLKQEDALKAQLKIAKKDARLVRDR